MSEWWREAIENAQTFQEIEAVFHRLWPELAKNKEAVASKLAKTAASEGAAIYKEMQPTVFKIDGNALEDEVRYERVR